MEEHLGTSQQAVQLPLIDAEEEKAVRLVADIDQLEQVYERDQLFIERQPQQLLREELVAS